MCGTANKWTMWYQMIGRVHTYIKLYVISFMEELTGLVKSNVWNSSYIAMCDLRCMDDLMQIGTWCQMDGKACS
jgi:hypothetical protein